MAAYVGFEQYVEDLHNGEHNFDADTLKVAFSAASPSVSADAVLTDITTIAETNLSSTTLVTNASTGQTTGTYKLVMDDLVLTASGAVPTFRYVIIYNSTATTLTNPLIMYADYGSDVTLADTETFTVDFGTELFQIT